MTHRQVKIAKASKTSENTTVKYRQRRGSKTGKFNIIFAFLIKQFNGYFTCALVLRWLGHPHKMFSFPISLSTHFFTTIIMYCLLIDNCNWLNNLFLRHCCLFVSIFLFFAEFCYVIYAERNIYTAATGQEMVREKPGNFTSSQEKVKSLKEVREKWNFKSTYLFFEHSMDINRFVLVENCPWKWTTSRCWLFKNINIVLHIM